MAKNYVNDIPLNATKMDRRIAYLGHWWTHASPSTLGNSFVTLYRRIGEGELRRSRGGVPSAIDAKRSVFNKKK